LGFNCFIVTSVREGRIKEEKSMKDYFCMVAASISALLNNGL